MKKIADLPDEIGKIVGTMQVGQISQAFTMTNPKTNRPLVAIVKLSKRIPAHRAELADDYQTIKDLYESKKKEQIIEKWVKEKQKTTYVNIQDGWRDCEFKYDWLHTGK